MRILQMMAGAKHGGAEMAFIDMCVAMHEAGEDIMVLTRPNEGRVPRLEQAGVPYVTLPFGGMFDVYTRLRIKSIIKAFKPNIVQSWMSRASNFVPKWKPSMGVPRYLSFARLGGYYKMKYFKTIDYFVPITPLIKDYLVEQGVPVERVSCINNFAETEEAGQALDRGVFGTPEDAPLLLTLSRLHTAKALDVLIKAVAEVPEVHLWMAGEGPEREVLEALVQALDLGGRVQFLGWRNDRADLLKTCDVCVFPSRYEPFGTVFVQAWANERPVITSTADGPRQFVRDGEDGLVVPIDDVGAMAEAIRRLIGDVGLRKKLVKNGLERYRGEFTKAQCLQAYLAWYHTGFEAEKLI